MKVVEGNLLFRATNPEDALLMQTISFALNNWFGSDVSDLKEIISNVSMAPVLHYALTRTIKVEQITI